MLTEKMPHELDEVEINLYHTAVGTYPESGGDAVVSSMIYNGMYKMFISDNAGAKTLAIVTLLTNPDESRNLHVLMLAGSGSLKEAASTLSDLAGLALDEDCDVLTGIIKAGLWQHIKVHFNDAIVDEYTICSFRVRPVKQKL